VLLNDRDCRFKVARDDTPSFKGTTRRPLKGAIQGFDIQRRGQLLCRQHGFGLVNVVVGLGEGSEGAFVTIQGSILLEGEPFPNGGRPPVWIAEQFANCAIVDPRLSHPG
jgi:hypothetical protein